MIRQIGYELVVHVWSHRRVLLVHRVSVIKSMPVTVNNIASNQYPDGDTATILPFFYLTRVTPGDIKCYQIS